MLLPMQGTRRRLLGMLSLGLFFTGLGLGKIGSPFSYPLQAWRFALALYFLATRLLRNSKSRPTVRGFLKLSIALLVAGSALATAASSAQVLSIKSDRHHPQLDGVGSLHLGSCGGTFLLCSSWTFLPTRLMPDLARPFSTTFVGRAKAALAS